jgi:hypothetical protein
MPLSQYARIAGLGCAAIMLVTAPAFGTTILPPRGSYNEVALNLCFMTTAPAPPEVCLNSAQHKDFVDVSSVFNSAGELEHFNSSFTGGLTLGGPTFTPIGPVTMTGAVSVMIFGRSSPLQVGTFSTEMLSLNLTTTSSPFPFMIRESPTSASTGQTTIADLGGGLFHVDSFFDVFTELSVNNGQTWVPMEQGPARVQLVDANGKPGITELVPEPASIFLVGAGAALAWILGLFAVPDMRSVVATGPIFPPSRECPLDRRR